jgi:hypothetical protein
MSGNFYRKRAADLVIKIVQAQDAQVRAALVCQAAQLYELATLVEAFAPGELPPPVVDSAIYAAC